MLNLVEINCIPGKGEIRKIYQYFALSNSYTNRNRFSHNIGEPAPDMFKYFMNHQARATKPSEISFRDNSSKRF